MIKNKPLTENENAVKVNLMNSTKDWKHSLKMSGNDLKSQAIRTLLELSKCFERKTSDSKRISSSFNRELSAK